MTQAQRGSLLTEFNLYEPQKQKAMINEYLNLKGGGHEHRRAT